MVLAAPRQICSGLSAGTFGDVVPMTIPSPYGPRPATPGLLTTGSECGPVDRGRAGALPAASITDESSRGPGCAQVPARGWHQEGRRLARKGSVWARGAVASDYDGSRGGCSFTGLDVRAQCEGPGRSGRPGRLPRRVAAPCPLQAPCRSERTGPQRPVGAALRVPQGEPLQPVGRR